MAKSFKGIELIKDTPEWKIFRTSCDCMSEDHTLTVDMEKDKETDLVSLSFYVYVTQQTFNNYRFHRRVWEKTKACYYIIRGKPVEFSFEFIFRGWEHIRDFVEIIEYLGSSLRK